MRVVMKVQIGGFRNGEAWPPPGASADVPEHEAADLCLAGYAEEAHGAQATTEPEPAPAENDGDGSIGDDGPEAVDDADAPAEVTTKGRKPRRG